jgi:tetratricopeptide (TPR) repeat protein
MMRTLFFAFLLVPAGKCVLAQSAHQLLRQGDREYQNAKYREAEEAYRQAGQKKANDPAVQYNTGNAIYQQGNYAASESYFEQAAKTAKEPAVRADAFHNLGNTFFKQQKYKEALNAYENSLRLRPGDVDTKVNLQMAKKKWQQQQEQQKKQEQQEQPQNQPQQDQSSGQQQQPNENQKQEQPQQPQEQPQQPEEQPSDGSMTREQARRLLETAVGPEDQKNARKYRELDPGKHKTQPKKDW